MKIRREVVVYVMYEGGKGDWREKKGGNKVSNKMKRKKD